MKTLAWLTLLVLATASVAVYHGGLTHDPSGYIYHLHSVMHPYTSNGMTIPNWDFFGSTVVTDDYIRLTPDRQSRRGSLWNIVPFNPPGNEEYPPFEINIQFKVHGQGTRLFGDGFAVWYTRDKGIEGPVFGNQDKFIGLGIFFDTYSNTMQGNGQSITAMFGDGLLTYDHENDGTSSKVAGCPIRFRAMSEEDADAYVRIVYHDKLLRVYVDPDGTEYDECFIVRRVYLPRGYYFGVSAATGELADNHDIIAFKVSEPAPMTMKEKNDIDRRINEDVQREKESIDNDNMDNPQSVNTKSGTETESTDDNTFTVLAVILVIGLIGVVVYFLVQSKKKAPKFDF